MAEPEAGLVLVQVVPLDDGRQIGWGSNLVERLAARAEDVKAAVAAGTQALAESLTTLPEPTDWQIKEVSGTFGISLTAEAGAVLSKASTEATFEVTITFHRLRPA